MNCIHIGDALRILATLKSRADLIFIDPPYNINKDYLGFKDRRPREVYLEWLRDLIVHSVAALKPRGSLYFAIDDNSAAEVKLLLDSAGLTRRNWLTWHFGFGNAARTKFTPSKTHIFYYVHDSKHFTWNGDQIRVPSARQLIYKDKRANPSGKIPDDTWAFQPDGDVWKESVVCGTFKERSQHPCQMPLTILERIILTSSNPGDLVLDPCCGSGTTLVAAKRQGREYVGIELVPDYAALAEQRLSA